MWYDSKSPSRVLNSKAHDILYFDIMLTHEELLDGKLGKKLKRMLLFLVKVKM